MAAPRPRICRTAGPALAAPMNRLSACFLILAAIPAAAQERSALAGPLRKFDANRDGKLEGRELVLARQSHNRGGREAEPDPGRWKEIMERFEREFLKRRQKEFDANHDGRLDDGERNAASAAWKIIGEGITRIRDDITARYDRNDDGELNDAERNASRQESERLRRELEEKVVAVRKAPPAPSP